MSWLSDGTERVSQWIHYRVMLLRGKKVCQGRVILFRDILP